MPQSETIKFLSSGRAFPDQETVKVIETHGAFIFLCGDTALKLKRAIKYDYMDLSTVALRRSMIEREFELNQRAAPEIYRDVLPVTRSEAGLSLGGEGPVVDWVLRMWRFPEEDELEHIADRGALDDRIATAMGTAIADYHTGAPVSVQSGRALMSGILDELGRVFAEFAGFAGTESVGEWQASAGARLEETGDLLDMRSRDGHVRRAHGDLHLRNLVLIDGRPVLFDALEFDETLGTCDILYDTAFLIMDLCYRHLPRQACRVLDAWLRTMRGSEDAGLGTLPLFISVRAAIRAMVALQTDAARGRSGESAESVAGYLELANAALVPAPPRLISVGGYSGSGKSVLVRELAPKIGPLPGAVLLSSDLERKVGMPAQAILDQSSYSLHHREAVYLTMFDRAATILAAGHSVILDATFLDPHLRNSAEDIAAHANVPFQGLWLDASNTVLRRRITSRKGDASDADVDVLETQLAQNLGVMTWHKLDASVDPQSVCASAWETCQKS